MYDFLTGAADDDVPFTLNYTSSNPKKSNEVRNAAPRGIPVLSIACVEKTTTSPTPPLIFWISMLFLIPPPPT